MTSTCFAHLERELRAGVRRHHKIAKRPWRRPTALALAAALVVSASALAATGTIQIGKPADSGPERPRPHEGPGLRAGPAETLALRSDDPAGGPPWTLRVFASTRGAHCVQVGQVVSGHFGVFVPPNTLEPLRAWPGGASSLCSGQSHGGFPVVRGLQRIRIVGGMTDRRRCPTAKDPRADCPLTSVTLLRYGLLGPDARRVRLINAEGRTLATATTNPRIGGAYVFAIALRRAKYAASDGARRLFAETLQREQKAARARGEAPDRALRKALSRARRGLANVNVRPPAVTVLATFANGQTLRVAGEGRTDAALPGLDRREPTTAPLPRNVPIIVGLAEPGRYATVTVAFRAPRAISRFDVHYLATLRGPTGVRCDRVTGGGHNATTTDIARGELVRFPMRRARSSKLNGRSGWCPGQYSGTIRYRTPQATTVIGRYHFMIP